MNDNFAIDQLIEEIASSGKIKSFYPISISKRLNLSLTIVLNRLNYLVEGGILRLRYEVRCTEHLTELNIVDSYDKVLGTYINCYECNDDILIGLENIFIVYFLNNDYIDSIKKKKSIFLNSAYNKQEKLNFSDAPQDMVSILKEVIGQTENTNFKNIENIDNNIGKIANILSNSGDKELINNFKEIDEEIEKDKKKSIGKKILDGAEGLGKLKDGTEAIEKFSPIIIDTMNRAITKWPEIHIYIDNFIKYIHSLF
ncbi:hypothetical protein UT300005_05910 [Clostridium sp. CTA-5]